MSKASLEVRIRRLLSKLHLARGEVSSLRRKMGDFICQHELGAELAESVREQNWHACIQDHREHPSGDDLKPCWKGKWESDGYDSEYVCLGDNRDGGWCGPCLDRERLRAPLAAARRRLAGLQSALWKLAADVHSVVEHELDRAGTK